MRLRLLVKVAIGLCLLICKPGYSQNSDTVSGKLLNFPSSFINKVDQKTASLEARLTRQTSKYLQRLGKKETRIKRKLARIDSVAVKNCFANDPVQQYQAFIQKLATDSGSNVNTLVGTYLPYIDSLKGTLSFLDRNPELAVSSKLIPTDIQRSLRNLQRLQSKMQQADQIKEFLQQRKHNIKNFLSHQAHLPKSLTTAFKDYNKQAYYYTQQVKEYKEILNDPDKMVKTALKVLNKLPAFTGFMQKHSMLASLFNLPGGIDNTATTQAVNGLQTRSQVMAALQNQMGSAGPNINGIIQQNMQAAQGQVNMLRNKLQSLGGGNGELEMPDFKPNNQRTKTFLQRLDIGTNIQSAQSNSFFPTTTDLGLSVGYKLNDKSTIGVGMSHKMGWGKDIRHISITHQGVGLRSFLDVKLKGSFYASGGFEYNYQPLTVDSTISLPVLGKETYWQQSGLIGLSKIISIKSKVFRKTRLQLLWDFLSYRQKPQTQALRFRVGYNF